ncbi:MAG: c-type cytochrome [Verrucomicrobiota bacterium]|nr:c-type cytochrome [Verrucomicrobiota bacterium]
MISKSRFSLFFALLITTSTLIAQTPEWIWHSKTEAEGDIALLRRTFVIKQAVTRAELAYAADNSAVAFLNGTQIGENKAWNDPSGINIRQKIREGENLLAFRARNEGGPGALIARLRLTYADGTQETIATDSSWKALKGDQSGFEKSDFNASQWNSAVSLGKIGIKPWGDIFAPKTATPAESITTLPGFKVELVRSSQNEGSWVAMTIDAKGRLIISPQEGRGNLLRVSLDSAGQVKTVEILDQLPLGGAMGLLWAFDSLYVSGAGPEGLGLYRVFDENGDDKLDKVSLLKKFDGAGGEHGSHALVMGPDKMLYYIHGNFVHVPGDLAASSPHRNYAEDQLLPRAEDGNGFGVGIKPPGGFILRTDPDGKHWEMVAGGMRNAYDFDFNQDGEMFTYDSDMEWDWGMPWYRQTRIYHLVSGGDYGFREGTAKFPTWYQDALPPVIEMGIGSPTGVKFGTGAKFPEKYQRALFAMEWTYGRIFAIHLDSKGATYSGSMETFIKGKPLNVTDMEVGHDGALYFMTGGRGTQSGLYRVSYVGNEKTGVASKTASDEHAEARALRKKLESFHGKKDPAAIDYAWPHLRSKDRWIRYAARIAIESQDVSLWKNKALEEENPYALITLMTALARNGEPQDLPALAERLGTPSYPDLPIEQSLESLRALSLAFIRLGSPDASLREGILNVLNPIYPSTSAELNRELVQVMIYLKAPGVIEKTLNLIRHAPTFEEQVSYVFHLRHLKEGWTMDQRREYFSWFQKDHSQARHPESLVSAFIEAGRDYGNGASFPKFLQNMRKDAVAALSDNERAELAGLITGDAAKPVTKAKERAFVKEWKVDDLVPQLDKVGSGRSYDRGREAFVAAQCLSCHRFGNEGGAVGPDITAVSSRFTRRDLLESIVEPSKVVSEQYQDTRFFLKNDEEVTGRVLEENETRLIVMVNALANVRAEVKKSEIQKKEPAKLSSMPEGLVNVLSAEEILDMLAFIEAAGKKDSPHF